MPLLELAAVAGSTFDLVLVEALAGSADGLEALLERGLLVEDEPSRAAFRHALTREAISSDSSWVRRRALHRRNVRARMAQAHPVTSRAPART